MTTGIIIVDHGSRLPNPTPSSNPSPEPSPTASPTQYPIVEPAHMEIAPPSIADAYAKCVQRRHPHHRRPLLLGPGKHWTHDIPNLTAQPRQPSPHTTYKVAPYLGLDDLLLDLLAKRTAKPSQLQKPNRIRRHIRSRHRLDPAPMHRARIDDARPPRRSHPLIAPLVRVPMNHVIKIPPARRTGPQQLVHQRTLVPVQQRNPLARECQSPENGLVTKKIQAARRSTGSPAGRYSLLPKQNETAAPQSAPACPATPGRRHADTPPDDAAPPLARLSLHRRIIIDI